MDEHMFALASDGRSGPVLRMSPLESCRRRVAKRIGVEKLVVPWGRGPVDFDERERELEAEADEHRALQVLRRQRYQRFKKYLAKVFGRPGSEARATDASPEG